MTDPNPYELPPEPTPLDDLEFTPSNEDRNLAVIAHLSGCAGIVAGGFIGFLGPLIIYLMSKDSSPYVAGQAKEALNFQITLLLIGVACVALTVLSCWILFPLLFIHPLLQIIYGIIAALAVRDGKDYHYPFNIRLFQ